MAKYKTKPLEIEAVQWLGGKMSEVTPWIDEARKKNPFKPGAINRVGEYIHLVTPYSSEIVSKYDYIVRDCKGDLSACKPDVFKATYEEVSDVSA